MKLKKGDLIKTKSNKEHKTVIRILKTNGFKINKHTWRDRHRDYSDRFNFILFDGKTFESFCYDDIEIPSIRKKIKRKVKAEKLISSYRTSYDNSKLKHRFF
jgi:nitrate/TMAO reductase-like tetraheme cytochrome c subunit